MADAVIPNAEAKTETSTTPATTPERPAWLPEKFKTPEDFAKSYTELEQKLGSAKTETEPKTEIEPKTPTQSQQVELSKYQEEFTKNGKLSEESLAALEKQGIARTVVDFYTRSYGNASAKPDLSVVGGEDAFNEIANWAKANMSQAEIDVYNEAFKSGPAASTLALRELKTKFEDANGVEPALVGGKPSAVAVGYRSMAELERDMRDPRYQKDPAFRADVEKKVGNSKGVI